MNCLFIIKGKLFQLRILNPPKDGRNGIGVGGTVRMGQEQENRNTFKILYNGKCLNSIYTRTSGALFTRDIHGSSIRSRCEVFPLLTISWRRA